MANIKKVFPVIVLLLLAQACSETPHYTGKKQTALTCLSFQDETFGSYAMSNWDSDQDGCLSKSESEGVLVLPENAFAGNTSLHSVSDLNQFPNLTAIGNGAFSGCTGLESAELTYIQSVGEKAFSDCTNLVSVSLPVATHISENAFDGCTNLENIIKPEPAKGCEEGTVVCSNDNKQALKCTNEYWIVKEFCSLGCTDGSCNPSSVKCPKTCPNDCNDQGVCNQHDIECPSECLNDCNDQGVCNQHGIECPEECQGDCNEHGVCNQHGIECPEECQYGCDEEGICTVVEPGADANHNHMDDIYEIAAKRGQSCRKYSDCDSVPGAGDGFCDSFIDYKCSTKCTSDDQCLDDNTYHYICRPDGRCAPDTFIFIVHIDAAGSGFAESSLTIDTSKATDCDFTIDWGDKSPVKHYTNDDLPRPKLIHDYADYDHTIKNGGNKNFTVKITGKYDGFFLDGLHDVYEIKSFGPVGLGDHGSEALFNFNDLKKVSEVDIPDASKLISLHRGIGMTEFFNQSINHWDVSNVTDMSRLFHGAVNYNKPLDKWDVHNVTNMSEMFGEGGYNQPLESWDVHNVTNMSGMFQNSSFNKPLEKWDVSNVTDMSWMFSGTYAFNQPLEKWDVSSVTNMRGMFAGAWEFNQPLEKWDVSSVTNMSDMFEGQYMENPYDQPLNGWDVSSVTDMNNMFRESKYNHPLNDWDVSSVTDMNQMFCEAELFNQPLNDWDVSSVTDMSYMFYRAAAFDQPLNQWDVSSVTEMSHMFDQATSFNSQINGWNASKVERMNYMFSEATSFNQPIDEWVLVNINELNYMFNNATSFNAAVFALPIKRFTMAGMFNNAKSFNQPLNWRLNRILNLEYVFYGASAFNQDISAWKDAGLETAVRIGEMFSRSGISKENYCKVITKWNYTGNPGMSYTCE